MFTTRPAHLLHAAPIAATAAALLTLAGCASVPSDAGFGDVRQTITERTSARIHWRQGTDEDRQVEHAVDQLLAQPLTPDSAAQIALLNNRELQATYEDLMIAQADLVSAGLLRNPIFSAEAKFFDGGTNLELGITQTFLDLLYLPMRRRIAASEFESAKQRIAAEVLALDRDTRAALYHLQAAQQRLDMRRQILAATEAAAQLAERLREAGNITEAELAIERVEHEESRLALAAAELETLAAREELNQLMGLWGPRAAYTIEPRLPDPPAGTLTAEDAEHLAVEHSLELAASRQEITTAATRLGFATPDALFDDLELGAGAEREEDGEWGLGPSLAVPLPLWSQGQPATAAARAELRRATSAHAAAVVRLRGQTRTAHAQLAEARQRLDHLRTTILPLRQRIVDQSMLRYNAMQIGTAELLATRRDQIRAGESLIDALEDYWTAHANLRYYLGGQLPTPDHGHTPAQPQGRAPEPAPDPTQHDTHDHTPRPPGGPPVNTPDPQTNPQQSPQLNPFLARALSRRSLLGMGALAGGAAILGRTHSALGHQPDHAHHNHSAAPTAQARPQAAQSADPLIHPPSVDAQGRPYSDTHWDTPGEPNRDYTPIITPSSWTLPFRIIDGVKVFHLTAEEVNNHEFAPGLRANCWGYNGSVHGPTIEAVEGDRVRIYVTNRLPAPTTVHWHGVLLPAGMDGVGGLNQPLIRPGETFKYEFTLRQHGTHMYHPHHDEMTQMSMGLMGLLIIHPRRPQMPRPDHDYAILLSEWHIPVGAARPNPNEMTDFNVLTFNAKAFPGTAPLLARLNSRVRIRLGNLSAMDHHPIHLHGYRFWITETDGGSIPPSAWWPETTAFVPVGSTRTMEFIADAPGDWAMHCHMTHHVMNQMGHDFPNMIGVDAGDLQERVRRLLPGYMVMGQHGMDHGEHIEAGHMPVPQNSIPMVGARGPFDYITMGGMFTILKVREQLPPDGGDPGWYDYPPDTVALHATPEELRRDQIDPASAPLAPSAPPRRPDAPAAPAHDAHDHHHR